MNLRALQYFVKLADLRHFSKAADACFVSQPTLSTQIKKLEEELGVQLVERSPKLIMLTPVGQDIANRARLVLRDLEQIRTVARRSSNPAEGALRVGLFPTLAPYYLPHVVPQIRRKYPSLRLQLAEEKTEDLLRMLQQGQLDTALLALPVAGEGMQIETLFEEPFVLALPADHPLAARSEVTLADLEGAELLLLEEGHCLRDHAIAACGARGAKAKAMVEATSLHTLIQMVEGGLGVTLLPELALKAGILNGTRLIARPFATQVPSRTVALAARPTNARAADVDLLAAYFEGHAREAASVRVPSRRKTR